MTKTGYKEMLRDRCPKVVDQALKFCKAKTRWVDHAYTNFVKIYKTKDERYEATRIVLGISSKYRNFNFDKSIDWENLSDEDTVYWKRVSSWVDWFRKNMLPIEESYNMYLSKGENEMNIKVHFIHTYLAGLMPNETDNEEEKESKYAFVDYLVNFLIDCLNNRI